MSQAEAGMSTDEAPLKQIFDDAMKLYDNIENGKDATNSEAVQMSIKSAIKKFEQATNLVSVSGMFSKNESLEELPTETLQYLLLPALLGSLTLKIIGRPRKEVIQTADIYFRDFLQRCKDYQVTDVEIPLSIESTESAPSRTPSEQAKIASMVLTRDAKIKRYKEEKELKEKLIKLSKAMSSGADDDVKRDYFVTLLGTYINQALDELNSLEQEKPILEYMEKHAAEPKPKAPRPAPLKPVIITRDAVQKAVYGIGYPSIPSMTVEEFYDRRVKEGLFPGSCSNIPHTTIQTTEEDADEADQVRKELLVEDEDPEELVRQRNMDEYKDDHRRGWGNRHNRS